MDRTFVRHRSKRLMPSLSPLVVSVVVISAINPSSVAGAGRAALEGPAVAGATNTERAKMGLLPRRAARSRVTYLDGADSPGKAAMVSPALDSQPITTVVDEEQDAATARVGAAAPEASAAAATAPDAPAPVEARAPAAPAAAAMVERVIDPAGEIVVRVVGQGAVVLGEKVVCSLGDLPVLSSRRAEDGSVVQMVQDEWGQIEIRRDAVGRFVSAKPIPLRASAAD